MQLYFLESDPRESWDAFKGWAEKIDASGIGKVGEKAATAIADFIVVDMFANYCTGAKDAKTAMAEAERQLKRIYR